METYQKETKRLKDKQEQLTNDQSKYQMLVGGHLRQDGKSFLPSSDLIQEVASNEGIPAPSKNTLRLSIIIYTILLLALSGFWILTMQEATALEGTKANIMAVLFGTQAILISFVVFRLWYSLEKSNATLPYKKLKIRKNLTYFITLLALAVEASVTGSTMLRMNSFSFMPNSELPLWIVIGLALASLFMIILSAYTGHILGLWEIAVTRTRWYVRTNPDKQEQLKHLAMIHTQLSQVNKDLTALEETPFYNQPALHLAQMNHQNQTTTQAKQPQSPSKHPHTKPLIAQHNQPQASTKNSSSKPINQEPPNTLLNQAKESKHAEV